MKFGWPGRRRPEERESSYTNALIASITANAGGHNDRMADRHGCA